MWYFCRFSGQIIICFPCYAPSQGSHNVSNDVAESYDWSKKDCDIFLNIFYKFKFIFQREAENIEVKAVPDVEYFYAP